MQRLEGAGVFGGRDGVHWVEQLRVSTMSVGTYSIPVGGVDDQTPHTEDEIYMVTAGSGKVTAGGQTIDVSAGTTLFVPAGEQHRYHDVVEDLALLVVIAPPYSGD